MGRSGRNVRRRTFCTVLPAVQSLGIWSSTSQASRTSLVQTFACGMSDLRSRRGGILIMKEAMRAGAYDYVQKPFDCEDVVRVARRALESVDLHRRVENLESELARRFPVAGIVGESEAIRATLESARKAAPTGATVLIKSESGTGKELLARFIHANSRRSEAPFVAVHCAALTENPMESELFGHEKEAFTNAHQMKLGRFDLAASGTLFFDEVGEMSLSTQVKLLRILGYRMARFGIPGPIRKMSDKRARTRVK